MTQWIISSNFFFDKKLQPKTKSLQTKPPPKTAPPFSHQNAFHALEGGFVFVRGGLTASPGLFDTMIDKVANLGDLTKASFYVPELYLDVPGS